MYTEAQEVAIINMVLVNNAIRLRVIQSHIMRDDTVFGNIRQVALSTLACVLQKHQVQARCTKQDVPGGM